MKLSFLYGVRWCDWWRLLAENRFAVDPSCWHRAALITLMAAANSWLARADDEVPLDDVPVEPPVFVLGHWRSGTTHLHYLLASDPALAAPTTYQCAYPHSFLSGERHHRRLIEPLAPRRRPQDGVEFHLGTPQEDEMGLAAMCGPSPYLGWAFPRRAEAYLRYLAFDDASDDERRAFAAALVAFVRKLSVRHRRPLVLKSPGHTARIPMLLECFPDARFVLITRNPYEVFQSSLHLYRTWLDRFAFLQRPDPQGLEERVLAIYERMHEHFFAHEARLPPGRYHRLRFEDLVRDPLGEMRRLYAGIDLDPVPEARLRAYLERVRGYRRTAHPPIVPRWREEVARRWARSFEAWGYPA